MERRYPGEEKGEWGHRVTCAISVKKLDNFPRLQLVNLPIFRLGIIFPRPGNIISGRISSIRMPKSNAQRGKEFRERKKEEKLAASPVEKVTKKTEK
ncbi:UNVERIFIED_CONTAM: hypothetical protein NCL1_44541 [Trichonephila clavipes]